MRASMRPLAGLVCAFVAFGQQSVKPRIAVKTFENPTVYSNSTIGNALTEILVTELSKTGKYALIERQAVDELLKEIHFGLTEWAKSATFAQLGQLLGAEYLLIGKVTNFGYKETAEQRDVYVSGRGRSTRTVYTQEADVRVDFRLVNVKTGEVILSEAGTGRRTAKSEHSEMEVWRVLLRSGTWTAEWASSLIGRASLDAVRSVVGKLRDLADEVAGYTAADAVERMVKGLESREGKILGAVSSEEFVVNLGTRDGLVVGDHLIAFTEIPVKNSKGEIVYRDRRELGKLEVADVSFAEDRAKARFVAASPGARAGGRPQEGDIVKVDVAHARVIRGAKPAGPGALPSGPGARPSESAVSVEPLLRRGDAYMDGKYYPQALRQYQQADQLKPNDPAILARIAKAQLHLRNFFELETIFENLLRDGQPVTVEVYHDHAFGSCAGTLAVGRGELSYQPRRGDHGFQVSPRQITYIEVSERETPFFHPCEIHWVGQQREEIQLRPNGVRSVRKDAARGG